MHLGVLAMSHFPSISLSPGNIPFPCSALGTHRRTVVGRTRPRFSKNIVYTYTINIVYKHTYRYLQTHTHITASKLWSCAVQWSLLEMPWDQHLEDWVTCLGASHRCRKLYLGTLFLNSSHIYKSIQLLELWSSETARQKGKYGSAHYMKCTVLCCSFLELVQACFIGALVKYENAICRKNKKYKDAKGLRSNSVSLQREKKKVLTISQVKFWLIQSQWELNQDQVFKL